MGTKWKCINCGETRNISMIPNRLSDYSNNSRSHNLQYSDIPLGNGRCIINGIFFASYSLSAIR